MRIFAATTALFVCFTISVQAHSIGDGNQSVLTPPMRYYTAQAEALEQDFKGAAPVVRGVFDELKIWNPGDVLHVCFYEGARDLKAFFVQTSRDWTKRTSIRLDYGQGPDFRKCNKAKPDDIRVSFKDGGNWSYVGTDSVIEELLKKPSLNIGYAASKPFKRLNKARLKELILHELGHALGLAHEHQSPASKCDAEFDWPKVYKRAKDVWGWDKSTVDHNLGVIKQTRLRMTDYDKASIMHYYFAPLLFKKGKNSRCYVTRERRLSALDRLTISEAYPARVAMQDDFLQERASRTGAVLASAGLDLDQLATLGPMLGPLAARFKRKLTLNFALVSSGLVLRGDAASFDDCDASGKNATPGVSCRVALDGSGFVLSVNP